MQPIVQNRSCPFCGGQIPAVAVWCMHCQANLPSAAPQPSAGLGPMVQELRRLTADADAPADRTGQPGKFRVATWIWIGVTAASLALFVVSPEPGLMILGVVLAFIFGIVALVFFFTDVATPAANGRASSREAILCYLKAIRFHRWDAAYACLSPMARARQVVDVPPIAEIDCGGGTAELTTRRGFRDYWKMLTMPTGGFGTFRRVLSVEASPQEERGGVQRWRVALKIEHYPQWIMLFVLIGVLIALILYLVMRRTYRAEFDLVTYKHNSQWWLATGELGSPMDRELVAALGADYRSGSPSAS